MTLHYDVPGDDMSLAGKASTEVKRALSRLGVNPAELKRVAVAMYEAEMNMVIHAGGGVANATIEPDKVTVVLEDSGPGIQDLDMAMQEGFSTAPERMRELGFGAGMGLPNMKRNSDYLDIDTEPGRGTRVTIVVRLGTPTGPDA
ncbi:MAG TPA: ATP-binding protein [Spirochaetales bacterium]|nr:ATP-binding protein [Spirochaetales bacterium]HPE36231.1 ATP-binding protein [Spirochaetales bacterium]